MKIIIYFIKGLKFLNLEVIYLIFKQSLIYPKNTGYFSIIRILRFKILIHSIDQCFMFLNDNYQLTWLV